MDHDLWVYTFKEGLLSRVAHDLKLKASQAAFSIDGPTGPLEVRVPADGLSVECAMEKGAERPAVLSSSDKAQIEKNIRREVLEAIRFPEIRFTAREVSETFVEGTLTLHGVSREIRIPLRSAGDDAWAEFELDQRDFRIKPYQAMLGALKVAPVVKVVARVKRWKQDASART